MKKLINNRRINKFISLNTVFVLLCISSYFLTTPALGSASKISITGESDSVNNVKSRKSNSSGLKNPATSNSNNSKQKIQFKKDQLIVKFKKRTSSDSKSRINKKIKVNSIKKYKKLNVELVKLPKKVSVEQALNYYRNLPEVEYAEPNYVRKLQSIPDDSKFSNQWGLHNSGQSVKGTAGLVDADIDMPEAWDLSTGNNEVVVAVLDTGVDYTHPDLTSNVWVNKNEIPDNNNDDDKNGYIDDIHGINSGYNYNDYGDPMDIDSHGTHVAGIIGAKGNNGQGISGVNWNVKILPINIFSYDDYTGDVGAYDSSIVEALEYVAEMKSRGVNIVATNNSYGGYGFSQSTYDQISKIEDAGILFVAAAGNGTNNNNDVNPLYPASYDHDNIISVAATDSSDNIASFSNYGSESVDIGAPGVNILSSVLPDENYTESSVVLRAVSVDAGVSYDAMVSYDALATYDAYGMEYAGVTGRNGVTRSVLYCGKGLSMTDFPAEVEGNIALIERGGASFYEKVENAQEAGAEGVIIFNNVEGNFLGTLVYPDYWIPAVSVSRASGLALTAMENPVVTLTNKPIEYKYGSGTSFSTPFVTGLAALIAGYNSSYDWQDIRQAILYSGDELGSLSGKVYTGSRINALGALNYKLRHSAKLSINSGQVSTKSRDVILEIQSEDSIQNLVAIGESKTGLADASWQSFESFENTETGGKRGTISYHIRSPGDGKKSIYIKTKDVDGNEGLPVKDEIILDTRESSDLSSKYKRAIHVENGDIFSSTVGPDGAVYLGGNFKSIGPKTGGGAAVNLSDGKRLIDFPDVDGEVYTVISDGSGGWFIGGYFSRVGMVARNNIARIFSDGSVDTSWNPGADAPVYALTADSSTVYAGGAFTQIGGKSRNYIASINKTNGIVTDWNPDADYYVYALAIDRSTLYVGGDFTYIGNEERYFIAAINTLTGQATFWNPDAWDTVFSLEVKGSIVYAGGFFQIIGGEFRSFIAALDSSGRATSWNPGANMPIFSIDCDDSTVYAGGMFSSIGGQSRKYLAGIDRLTGMATNWNPNPDNVIFSLAAGGSSVFIGGAFTNVGGKARNYAAAINKTNGEISNWNPNANNRVYFLATDGTSLYLGGKFESIGMKARSCLASLDPESGEITDWNPGADGSVKSIYVRGNEVFIGGDFANVGGKARNYLASVDSKNGIATSWYPQANNSVNDIASDGSDVFIGGNFTAVRGKPRDHLASIDIYTGLVNDWQCNTNGAVNDILLSGGALYAGGNFTLVDAQSRNYIAAVDLNSAEPTSWDPGTSAKVSTIETDGTAIYLGGDFLNAGGKSRNYLAAVDILSGEPTAWNPMINGPVRSIKLFDKQLYVGGEFTRVENYVRSYASSFDHVSGNVTNWNPNIPGKVSTLTFNDEFVYAGGFYDGSNGSGAGHFSTFSMPDNKAPVTTLFSTPKEIIINGWLTAKQKLFLLRNEAGTTYYRWGAAGSYKIYTSSIIAPEGKNTLYYYSIDKDGNSEPTKNIQFNVDTIGPATSFKSTAKLQGSYVKGNLVIPVSVSDASSGVQKVLLYDGLKLKSTDTSGPYLFNLNTKELANGKHTFKVVSYDKAGNSSILTRYYYVDNTRPKTFAPFSSTASKSSNVSLFYKVNDAFSPKADVTITIKNQDGVKVKTIHIGYKNTNDLQVYTFMVSLLPGKYSFYIFATDKAGNAQSNIAQNTLVIK